MSNDVATGEEALEFLRWAFPQASQLATLDEIADGLACVSPRCPAPAVALSKVAGYSFQPHCAKHAQPGDLYLRLPEGQE